MGNVSRGTKASGGTNFSPNTTILNDEVDTDFNTLYSDYNGNIANVNVSGSADIAQSKIADHGTQSTATNPGTPGSESTPTTLAGDIERLRYAIAQLKFGNASDQGGALEWFERSANFVSGWNNLLKNASFAAFQSPASTSAPDDWSTVGPATQYDHTALVAADGLDLGYHLKITGSGAANTGVSQTLATASLRPSTTYLFYCMAWATSGDTARVNVTTSGGTDLDISTTSTTPVLMQGFFTTNATPSNAVVNLLSSGATDVSNFYACRVIPVVTTPRRQSYTSAFLQLETAAAAAITSLGNIPALGSALAGATWTNGAGTALERRIAVPGPGYMLRVSARASFSINASAGVGRVMLFESTDGGVNWALRDGAESSVGTTAAAVGDSVYLSYSANATPGLIYRFRVTALVEVSGAITPQGAAAGSDTHSKSFLHVELIPTGD
jgi:hypothetical protein